MIITKKKKKKSEDIAPVLSEETKQAIKTTAKSTVDKAIEGTSLGRIKDTWSNGYQVGDITNTILNARSIFDPATMMRDQITKTAKSAVDMVKSADGNFLKSSKAKENLSNIWDDGYQFGDIAKSRKEVTKTILGTAGDVTANLAKGELQTAEGLVDTGRYVVSDVAKLLGADKYSANVKERAKQNTTGFIFGENDEFNNPKENGWAKKLDEYSVFDNKMDQIVQSVGQQGFRVGLQGAIGMTGASEGTVEALNKLEIFAGSYGTAKSEALANGASDRDATIRGVISGTAEYISENLFDSLPGFKTGEAAGVSKLKSIIGESAEKTFGKGAGKVILRVFGASGEGFEEILSNGLETAGTDIANLIASDYNYGMQEGQGLNEDTFIKNAAKLFKDVYGSAVSKESGEAFVSAFFSTLITGAISDGMTQADRRSVIKAYAKDNNISEEQATKLFDGIRDLRTKQVTNANDTFETKSNIKDQISRQLSQEIKNNKDLNLQELQEGLINRDKFIQAVGAGVASSRGLDLVESYKAYNGDSKYTNEIQNIQKFMNNRNIDARFDATMFDNNEQNAIWTTENGQDSVVFNPNASQEQVIQSIATHEMTHDIINQKTEAGTSLFNDVLNEIKNKENYAKDRQEIEDLYAKYYDRNSKDFSAKVDEEMVANELGKNLGTQEYINRLVNEKPNLARRIYNWVVDKLDNIGKSEEYKEQKAYWKSVADKFEVAYNEQKTATGENKTAYSLNKDVNDYITRNNYTFSDNGNLTVNNLTEKQIKDLVKLYHTTGYEDVSTEYLEERLREGNMPIMREVADRFIEKELGYKPKYDTTKIFEDAEGNKLTKEQVEFYKDSDVRDIRGRLIPVYHRTNAEFTEFDSKAGKQHGNKYGKGFYFSITPENYGNNTMKLYLNAKEGEFKYVPKMGYYIVQNPNMIKNVDNLKPTSSNDIRYSLSKNALREVSDVISQTQQEAKESNTQFVKLKDNTPSILVNTGVRDLPMLERVGHVRENILTDSEAQKLGFSIKNKHFHGLGVKTYLEIIDAMDNATNLYQYTNDNKHFIVETPVEINGMKAIVPVSIEDNGRYNNVNIDFNRIRTAFDPTPNYIDNLLKNGKIKEMVIGVKNQQASLVDNNIPLNEQNVKYSLTKDNTGRELSEGQREYFKDVSPKLKDNNGNIKVLYHGTKNDFNIFDTSKFGNQNGTAEGFGIYLTDNKTVADDYGNRIIESYAKITNPASTTELTTTKQKLVDAIRELSTKEAQQFVDDGDYDNINDALKDTWISNYTYTYDKSIEQSYNEVADFILNSSENDFEVMQELMNGSGNNDYKLADGFYDTITNTLGFDGIYTKWDFKDNDLKNKNADIFIAFKSNQVKNVDNLNPTEDADIRYSMQQQETPTTPGTRTTIGELFDKNIAPIREDLSNITEQMNNLSNQLETMQESLKNTSESTNRGYVEPFREQRYENQSYTPLTEQDAELYQNALMNDEGYLNSLENQANLEQNQALINKLSDEVQNILKLTTKEKATLQNLITDAVDNQLNSDEILEKLNREFALKKAKLDNDALFEDAADYIHEGIVNDFYNTQLESQASLDKDIQFNMTEDIAPTTIRSQESIDEMIDNRDIAPVRQDTQKPQSQIRERLETMRRKWGEMVTNRNYEIDKVAQLTGNNEIKFSGDNLNNVSGETQFNINNSQTDVNGKWVGKGLHKLFEGARNEGLADVYNDYLYHKSNVERHNVGKGSEIPLAVSQQLVAKYEQQYPQVKEWARELYKFEDNLLQEQVDSGIISQEKYNDYRGEHGIYRSYVPFYEARESHPNITYDDEGNIKAYSTLKRSKGGATDVSGMLSMEEAIARQVYASKKAIRENELYKEIVSSLDKYDDMMSQDIRDNPTNLEDSLYITPDGEKVLSAYFDGEKVSAKISEELYNELARTNENRIKQIEEDFSLITNPLQKISSVRRNVLTTWNPTFLARNAIKDIQDAVINSKYTGDMLANYFGTKKGSKSAISELSNANTETAQQFLALYGADNLYGDYSNVTDGKVKSQKGINKFARINELIELAPRYAEFKATLQNGGTVNEAIYNAREVTTNFGRGGYITKALNRNGFTFLNANVQGLDKVIRNLSGENGVKGVTSVIAKGAAFAVLPSILNHLLYGSGDDKDEEYDALPDYIKDNYFLVKLMNGKFLRIPKGRINAVFGSLARRTIEAMEGEENAYESWGSNAWSQIGVGDSSGLQTVFTPITQAINNEAWYGGDIVPTRLQNKPAAEQTDASIDALSNFIGKTFNISPYKVNYVIDQYSGGLGDVLLPMMTEETTSGAETPIDYLTAPIKDAFIVNSIDDNKYASEFYNMKDKLQIKSNSQYATDEDKIRYKYMSNISSRMSDLYAERREVQADTTLSNKEKYAKVQAIQKEINALAKEAMNSYNSFTSTDSYVSVGDVEYYKNDKGEWTKVNDSDSEFTAGMTDSEKTSYYNVKNKIGDIVSTYNNNIKDINDDNLKAQYQSQKRNDITQAIVHSGLDNYSKAMVYSKYYSSADTMKNVANAGYNVDTYITALQDIEELRTKYSQKNGYSTEQRKQKTIAYINSLDMNIPQKAMLIRNYYSSFRSYNTNIVEYVNSLNIPYEDKKAILEGTGMTVNGNKISWK